MNINENYLNLKFTIIKNKEIAIVFGNERELLKLEKISLENDLKVLVGDEEVGCIVCKLRTMQFNENGNYISAILDILRIEE